MLSFSIGSTLVDTQAASIPVVLRSPVFTDDGKIPGSFIFNFTLPLTDDLKQELAHAHRPARKGKPTWQHPDKNIRILVPNILAAEYAGIFAIWSIRQLPIEPLENDMSYLYCTEIEPAFQELVNGLLQAQMIQIENLQESINNYV